MDQYVLIGGVYRNVIKPIFFRFDPEFVHDSITNIGKLLGSNALSRSITSKILAFQDKSLEQTVAGIKFKNPVGLSAGFDKNASLIKILPEVGFGFMEIGSVTLKPYVGNPTPRLFRLPKSKALVVYYGLMNIGVEKIVNKIKKIGKPKAILGISIAKTNCKETSIEENGIIDYYECLKYLHQNDSGDYYTVNISCPNTFGGEPFTTSEKLERLLSKLVTVKTLKPIFIKMPINLDIKDFDSLLQIAIKYKISGVIIGNLTKVRDPELIKDELPEKIKGGISGKPTEKLSNDLISYTYQHYKDKLIIIGVGGIFSAQDAYEKIKRGATLLQLITGMVFQGPQLIGEINKGLIKLLKEDDYSSISEAIGAYYN